MRDKILQALRTAGHGLTPKKLLWSLPDNDIMPHNLYYTFFETLRSMEYDKLIILHRSSGSAGIPKGEIVLITLRPEGH